MGRRDKPRRERQLSGGLRSGLPGPAAAAAAPAPLDLEIPRLACWLLAGAAFAFFLFHKIDLTTADLGRHLKNGEWFLTHGRIPSTNFYSYTFPDFPAVNHHWGGGVLFYLVWKLAGFPGLTVLFTAVSLATWGFFFSVAEQEAGKNLALVVSLLVTPLLAERLEVRPEALSNLFCGAFFWILWNHRRRPELSRWFWALPALEVLWVNSHIYFFLGPVLVAVFWAAARVDGRDASAERALLLLLLATAAATLATPFGVHGALAPLEVFQNYGYKIVENQSIATLIRVAYPRPNIFWFEFVFATLAAASVTAFLRGRLIPLAALLLAAGFSAMGWLALRNLTLFGLFMIPLLSLAVQRALFAREDGRLAGSWTLAAAALVAALAYSSQRGAILSAARSLGAGLVPGNLRPAEYFARNGLTGPIMNDYDIGSYLIYTLPENERVFVDNRPEAYPASFFQDVYIPMQTDETVWRREDALRRFNAIYFDYHEHASWSEGFIVRRLLDPDWAPVYADGQVIIWLRRTPGNRAVIQRDAIPRSRFNVPRSWLKAAGIQNESSAAKAAIR